MSRGEILLHIDGCCSMTWVSQSVRDMLEPQLLIHRNCMREFSKAFYVEVAVACRPCRFNDLLHKFLAHTLATKLWREIKFNEFGIPLWQTFCWVISTSSKYFSFIFHYKILTPWMLKVLEHSLRTWIIIHRVEQRCMIFLKHWTDELCQSIIVRVLYMSYCY